MIYLSEYLDDQQNGAKVAGLIKEVGPKYESFTDRVTQAIENLGRRVKGVFERFTDQKEDEKKAPVYDADAPEGTIPLKTLKPVARPPAWAQKKKRPASSPGA